MHAMDRMVSAGVAASSAAHPGVKSKDFGPQVLSFFTASDAGVACIRNAEFDVLHTALQYAHDFDIIPQLVPLFC